MRRGFLKKTVLAAMALTLGLSTLSAKEADWPKEIKFGILETGVDAAVRSENIKDDEISVHVLQEDLFDHEVISNQVV
jgi:ABC-type phosphate/phosphonate transport system substrate-binding protein